MKRALLSIIVVLVTGSSAAGQEQDSTEQFVARARRATEKYQERAVAIREGYRRIGRDFPAMGEHWINIGLLFDGNYESIDADFLFTQSITRSIHVDTQYMLWVMDAVDGADNLIRELGLQPKVN